MFPFKPLALVAATLVVLPTTIVAPSVAATAQTTPDPKSEASRLFNQGLQQYRDNQVEAALRSWQQALTLYRQLKDRDGEGRALGNLGLVSYSLGNYLHAIDYHQQSLATARELNDRESEGKSLHNLGNAYEALSNYPKATEYYQQALAIARDLKNRASEGKTLNNLGNVYRVLGDYPQAAAHYQQALAIARDLKNRASEGRSLGNLGLVYHALGNYPKAIEYHQQALAIARETKNRLGEANSFGNLGLVYRVLGDYPKAIEYHQQRLTITRELKDRWGEGQALGNLSTVYRSLENYPQSIQYQQQSLAIAREIKDRLGELQSLGGLGLSYYGLEDYPKAIEYHQQALTIARDLKNRLGESRSLGNLGIAYQSLKNYPQAIEYHQQALAIVRDLKNPMGEGLSLNNLASSYFKLNQYPQAETALFAALQIWESLRPGLSDENKISLFETQGNAYRNLQQVLVAQTKTDAALEVAERGRSRAFVELLSTRLQKQGTKESVQPPNLQQIRQIAQDHNATLVQYSIIHDTELYIWVIQPTGKIDFRRVDLQASLPKGVALEEYVRTVRSESLGARGLGVMARPGATASQPATALQDLHRLLIQPIAPLLPTNPTARVIFLPQGPLFLVPFAALRSPEGKYLIEQHTLLTAPSIQVLDLTRQKQRARQKVTGSLIVGNPTMPSLAFAPGEAPEPLPELPGAEAEAKAIAQFLQTTALTGNQATKAMVKRQMASARLIHLATHGLLDDQRGIGSAIALAPSGTDNGFLTAEEILDLKLNADLVVLSACDTGRGKITGDGVIGLSRSLISAGAPSVIVSLWAVPDAPTAALMTQFYRNLQNSPDKAQALRQAMLTTMQQHPQPRDWAAFTLIGEAE